MQGLHVHVGSQILDVEPFADSVAPVAALGEFPVYDLGGGLGSRYTWAGAAPVDAASGFACEVQVRAHGDPVPAWAQLDGGELVIRLDAPIEGVAPGQTAVVYVGTRVVGQCTIDRTVAADLAADLASAAG